MITGLQAPLRIGAEHALMACEQGAKWQKAVNLLDMLWDYSIIPNEENFMPAIRACENAGASGLCLAAA